MKGGPLPGAPPGFPAEMDFGLQLTRYGPQSWLLHVPSERGVGLSWSDHPWGRAVADRPPPGLREVVPAFANVLFDFQDQSSAVHAERWFRAAALHLPGAVSHALSGGLRPVAELPVVFDGADLAEVAHHAGCSIDEAIGRFVEADYGVVCLGFSPGFPYLSGLPASLQTPRRAVPRTRVPAGSVGVGGSHAGIYPTPSPGGWNLLGRTSERLVEPRATSLESMFRLWPGDRVRFRPVAGSVMADWQDRPDTRVHYAPPQTPVLRIEALGMGMTVQDLGRPGFRRFGVPVGGAMDPRAASAANRLLENPPEMPVLECCGLGQRLTALRDVWISLAGAHAKPGELGTTRRLRAGETLTLPQNSGGGVWSYLAIPGGFAAERCLGSASTNRRAGLGSMLQPGMLLGDEASAIRSWPDAIARRSLLAEAEAFRPFRVWPGPQWRAFPEEAREALIRDPWTISTHCDRVGYRLGGLPLAVRAAEMTSEPVLPGSIQVPPDGLPIVTMPDGPTLGGYPKIGLVDPDDLPRLAQRPPGSGVRFEWIRG